MDRLRNFMTGRYGGDQLSMVLLILSIILTFIGKISRLPFIILIAYIPLGISIFRMFSRNIQKRSMENYKFAILMSPMYGWLKNKEKHLKDSKIYKYYKCPNCKQKLRLPRGKGSITITCPKCKTKFDKRT